MTDEERILQQYRNMIYSVTKRYRDRNFYEDLHIEVTESVLIAYRNYNGSTKLSTHLISAATHAMYHYLRDNKVFDKPLIDIDSPSLLHLQSQGYEELISNATLKYIFSRLDDIQKYILKRLIVDDATTREVGKELGISCMAVSNRFKTIKKICERLLGDKNES